MEQVEERKPTETSRLVHTLLHRAMRCAFCTDALRLGLLPNLKFVRRLGPDWSGPDRTRMQSCFSCTVLLLLFLAATVPFTTAEGTNI